jgi:argininosuccinate lyase
MSRGKTEKLVSMALASIAATLSRLAMDGCLYLSQNFGFISFPPELTTGSSIMPHKKNPDVFELIRGKCNRIQSVPNELTLLTNNLPSGYHREMQLTKEILFPAMEELRSCLQMMQVMISALEVKENILADEKYRYLFSVEAVNALVNKGMSFREAYQAVGNQIDQGNFQFDLSQPLHHTHEGSLGNLCNKEIRMEMQKVQDKFFSPRTA